MGEVQQGALASFFRFVIAKRWWILAFYALLLPLAILFALRVEQDNSLDKLIVETDTDYVNTKAFEKVFGTGEYILLLAEADDPFAPDVLGRIDAIERKLSEIRLRSGGDERRSPALTGPGAAAGTDAGTAPTAEERGNHSAVEGQSPPPDARTPASDERTVLPPPVVSAPGADPGPAPAGQSDPAPPVEPSSALTAFRQARGRFEATPEQAEAFRKFATGTSLFRDQGLIGERFFAIPVVLHNRSAQELTALLNAIDDTIAGFQKNPAPLLALRKIGGAYVNAYLDAETARSTARFMPFFGLLLLGLNFSLYRSFRTLLAFIGTLGVAVAMTVGFVGVTGGVLTIVSPLVPMTILITCTSTLVYIHSRFVDHPEGDPVEDHQVFALTNKFTACTASIFATAVGFGALSVSQIRPIRQMGIWVAVGLVFTWIIVFTLFPALQRILRTPTHQQRRSAGHWFHGLSERLPRFSYRWRWPLVVSSLLMCAVGGAAIFGIPGLLPPMRLETDGIEYINHSSQLYKDTKRFEQVIAGLSVTEVWLKGEPAALTDPDVLRGLDRFQESLRKEEGVGAVAGPTTVLRMLRYLGGGGDTFPEEPAEAQKLASDLELLRPTQMELAGFIDPSFSQTHIVVISKAVDYEAFRRLDGLIRERWAHAVSLFPALARFELKTVGVGPLQAKIAYHLVPTLVESFAITVAIIFSAFLILFRGNWPARLMAMIPSLFAILVMFVVMRVTGMALNVATILIASTVLGTSENDQIHFFYHFLEKRRNGSAEEGMRHTLRIAGRAIFFATIINAGGFLAFVFADLPPMREFGILTALAFLLSMLADFTALPAALWIIYRERPHPGSSPP